MINTGGKLDMIKAIFFDSILLQKYYNVAILCLLVKNLNGQHRYFHGCNNFVTF